MEKYFLKEFFIKEKIVDHRKKINDILNYLDDLSPKEIDKINADLSIELDDEFDSSFDIDLEKDELLTSISLLHHSINPPNLNPLKKQHIEDELLTLFEQMNALQKENNNQAKKQNSLLDSFIKWCFPPSSKAFSFSSLFSRPILGFAGTMMALMIAWFSFSPMLSNIQNNNDYQNNIMPLAVDYKSPWDDSVNPFDVTKNSSERLEKVLSSLRDQRRERWAEKLSSRQILGL